MFTEKQWKDRERRTLRPHLFEWFFKVTSGKEIK